MLCGAARAVGPRSVDMPTSVCTVKQLQTRLYKETTTGTRSGEASPGNGEDCRRSAKARVESEATWEGEDRQ